ncbi:MAG: endonuclease III [Candidatus Binatus sp.]|uniref:endonuclease III n=1 Tax=Candidatus Binatus sp. TaxID=2811406 RepID=UPI00271CC671|nr:endonuclease III [Candidatus Binatus sp.]MDO8430933.1 endonuclease III [Candidatus Binatus sp.]
MAAREPIAALKNRAARVSAALAKLYPNARISLDFATPWQCLAATILSAQCTDERVNQVTPALFREYPDARAMANADPERIQKLIVTTGFFRQKTRSLIASARAIVERHGGEAPSELEDLVKLQGVGRKTANVILGHVYGKPGFVVDTHVRRLTKRLGFTRSTEPFEIERDLQAILPPRDWTPFSMRLILHGRQVCHARGPRCDECVVAGDCPKIGVVNKARVAKKRPRRIDAAQ